ncbi:MAG: hypothetical protein V4671_03470 [Armatimonadota bacterium]
MTTYSYSPAGDRRYPWRAFFVALLLYIFLSIREMSAWTTPVWAILAFVAIPGAGALALGQWPGGTFRERFWVTLGSVGTAMALYTVFHLIRLHRHIGSTSESATAVNVFFVILSISVLYGIGAGLIGAAVGQIRARVGSKGARN